MAILKQYLGFANGQWPQENFWSYGKMAYGQQSQSVRMAIINHWSQSNKKTI